MRYNATIRFFGLTIPFLTLIAILFALSDTASADLLCVKRSLALSKGELRLPPAVKVVDSACPKGFVPLLDTSSLQGVAGSNGKAALGAENCTERKVTAVKVNTSADRITANRDVTCNSGEFVHFSTFVERTFEYSADWSVDGDVSTAGTTLRVTMGNADLSTPVLTSTGIHSGFQYSLGGTAYGSVLGSVDLTEAGTITGSLTTTHIYSFLCCKMGE